MGDGQAVGEPSADGQEVPAPCSDGLGALGWAGEEARGESVVPEGIFKVVPLRE